MIFLKIRLLGHFHIWRGGQLITEEEWPTQKTKSLLKLLLVERNHIVPKERLMELLWPDLKPSSAANSLRVAVSHARSTLEPDLDRPADSHFILTRPHGYLFQVTPDCWIDTDVFQNAITKGHEFEQREEWAPAIAAYQKAEGLYRGDYLEENPYEDWAIGPREQLREVYLDMLSRLAECHARQRHYRRALAACQKALTQDPLRESVYRQAMLCHYRLGQRDRALWAFGQCREVLAEELGVDPMPETVELHARILREELIDHAVLIRPTPAPAKPRRRPLPAWLPFVGREAESEALANHLATAMERQGRLVLIAGEAGVGKTRLAEEFLALAEERGAQVLRGRAYELERDLPFQPVREALRRHLLRALDPDRARQVLGAWAPHVALLIPEIHQLLPDLPALHPLPPEEERQRLLMGLRQFCLSLSGLAPLVLFLDDLQWADPSTVQFLHLLVRHIAREPVMVLGTYRAEAVGPDHPLTTMQRHLMREGLAVRLVLQRLSAEAVRQLVEQKMAPGWRDGAFSRRLYAETEGNPLFLAETLRSLVDAGLLTEGSAGRWQPAPGADASTKLSTSLPATVQTVIEARCQAAGQTGQRVLRTAAVIGRTFGFDLLRQAGDLHTDTLLDVVDDLVARQLVHEQPEVEDTGYNFSHDKIREVVYGSLSPARRRYLHRQVATALEGLHEGRTDDIAADLAHHYVEAGEAEQAAAYLLQAGDQARRLYAHEEAVAYLRRALELTPETDDAARYAILSARERVYNIQGARETQQEDLEALEELAEALENDRRRAEVALRRAEYAEETGDYPAAGVSAQEAVALAQAADVVESQAVGHLQWGRVLHWQADYEAAGVQLETALRLARVAGLARVEADCLRSLGLVASAQTDYVAEQAYYEQALSIYREIGDRRGESTALNNLGVFSQFSGDYVAARTYYEQALSVFHEIGHRQGEGLALTNLGLLADHQRDFAEAQANLEQALEIYRDLGDRPRQSFALWGRGEVAADQGDFADARPYFEKSLGLAREIGDPSQEIYGLHSLGDLAYYQGDYATARAYYEEALDIEREIGHEWYEGYTLAYLGLLFHDLGDDEAALEHGQQALRIARDKGSQYPLGRALIYMGHILGGLGRLEEAAVHYQEALNLWREMGLPIQAMQPLAGLARVCLAQGDLAQAHLHVEEILSDLEPKSLSLADRPYWIYLSCYRVLQANQDPRAQEILTMAHNLLQAQAAKIEDEAMRRSFLENVPAHRDILSEFRESEQGPERG